MSIQKTFSNFKGKINKKTSKALEEELKDIAEYAVVISPVSTGAYVTSFSIGKSGFGGGRSKSSKDAPKGQNTQAKQQEGLANLNTDIKGLQIEKDLKAGNARYTLRNRSDHAQDVEDGMTWQRTQGYHVMAKVKRKFS